MNGVLNDLIGLIPSAHGADCETTRRAGVLRRAAERILDLEEQNAGLLEALECIVDDQKVTLRCLLPGVYARAVSAIAKAKGEPQANPGHTGGTRPAIDPEAL